MNRFLTLVMVVALATGVVWGQEKKTAKGKKAEPVAAPKPTPPKGPETFQVEFKTTCGDFVIEVTRKWAPVGADRFHEAVSGRFYDGCGFFRVVPNFVVQFGINGDPKVQARWSKAFLKDDRFVGKSNLKGYVTYATAGANTRTAQLFINLKNNAFLDQMGFTPFGKVVKGLATVEKINAEYGQSPSQGQIQSSGNAYLKRKFPRMDFIKTARVLKPAAKKKPAEKK